MIGVHGDGGNQHWNYVIVQHWVKWNISSITNQIENNEEMKQDCTFNSFQEHNINILKVAYTSLIQKV